MRAKQSRGSRPSSESAEEVAIDQFGQRLAEYLQTDRSYAILGSEGTWNAGGCTLLAETLRRHLGDRARIFFIASDRNRAEHSVVRVGTRYLDADGAQTLPQLLDKMVSVEDIPRPYLTTFSLEKAIAADHVYSEAQVTKLKRDIAKLVGQP